MGTALQLSEARTLALAGGGAMIVHGFTDRATRDVDLFTEIDDSEAVRVAIARLDDAEWAEDGVPAQVVTSLQSTFDSWRVALQDGR